MQHTHPRTGFLLGWAGGAVLTALLLTTLPAAADGDPATEDVGVLLPYQGYLEKDGEPVDAEVDVTFRLWDGDTQRFSESQTVSVFAGRLTAVIGSTSAASSDALAAAYDNADALELEVVINDPSGDVVLDNRKPITITPYAMMSRSVVAPEVGGRLVVESDLVIAADSSEAPFVITDGDGAQLLLDGDEINSDGVLDILGTDGSTLLGGNLIVEDGALKLTKVDGSVVEVARANDDGQLVINEDGNAAGFIYLDSWVQFEGTVSGLSGSITFDEDFCQYHELTGFSGTITRECPDGYAWVGGQWGGFVLNGSKGLMRMKCCPIEAATVQ